MKTVLALLVLATSLTLSFGCGGKTPPPPAAPPATADTSTPPGGGSPAPAALLPVSSAMGGDGMATEGATVRFELPPGWRSSQPTSSMRVAQAAIPGPGGDGELAVFWFGEGQGGDVESNLQRWVGQMNLTPGTNPRRDSFESNGLRITWVDVQGELSATAMGNSTGAARGGWRLYGAVVEGPGGPWFFKATGPESTLAAQRDAYLAMLRSAQVPAVRPGA